MKLLYVSFVMVFIIGLSMSLYHNGSESKKDFSKRYRFDTRINNALFVLCCFGIGFSFNYLILERLMYIAAYVFAIKIASTKGKKKPSKFNSVLAPFLIYIVYINDINIFIVNAIGHYYL